MPRVINTAIPRDDRAVVQMHIDSINAALSGDDLTQMDVLVGPDGYTLEQTAADRFSGKLAWLVAHQTPRVSPRQAALPSVAPSLKAAAEFFGVDLPVAPTGVPKVDDVIIERPE